MKKVNLETLFRITFEARVIFIIYLTKAKTTSFTIRLKCFKETQVPK